MAVVEGSEVDVGFDLPVGDVAERFDAWLRSFAFYAIRLLFDYLLLPLAGG